MKGLLLAPACKDRDGIGRSFDRVGPTGVLESGGRQASALQGGEGKTCSIKRAIALLVRALGFCARATSMADCGHERSKTAPLAGKRAVGLLF
jgi:hypothetical protein